jgi:hypothetical protein
MSSIELKGITKNIVAMSGIRYADGIIVSRQHASPDLQVVEKGIIDDFVKDIFGKDGKVLTEYAQRFPGYGITGHTSEQFWGVFTGSGSNGKSLFVVLLEKLREEEWVETGERLLISSSITLNQV